MSGEIGSVSCFSAEPTPKSFQFRVGPPTSFRCPMCAELCRNEAIRCPHCGEEPLTEPREILVGRSTGQNQSKTTPDGRSPPPRPSRRRKRHSERLVDGPVPVNASRKGGGAATSLAVNTQLNSPQKIGSSLLGGSLQQQRSPPTKLAPLSPSARGSLSLTDGSQHDSEPIYEASPHSKPTTYPRNDGHPESPPRRYGNLMVFDAGPKSYRNAEPRQLSPFREVSESSLTDVEPNSLRNGDPLSSSSPPPLFKSATDSHLHDHTKDNWSLKVSSSTILILVNAYLSQAAESDTYGQVSGPFPPFQPGLQPQFWPDEQS